MKRRLQNLRGALKVNSMLTETGRLFEGKVLDLNLWLSTVKVNIMYLLTDLEGWTGKYLACGCEVIIRTELGKVSLL